MSDEQKATENEVFSQELSLDDLDAAAGGWFDDSPDNNCDDLDKRSIYGGDGFPNCARTVEDGSWCHSSDACLYFAIEYEDTTDCSKAWR